MHLTSTSDSNLNCINMVFRINETSNDNFINTYIDNKFHMLTITLSFVYFDTITIIDEEHKEKWKKFHDKLFTAEHGFDLDLKYYN